MKINRFNTVYEIEIGDVVTNHSGALFLVIESSDPEYEASVLNLEDCSIYDDIRVMSDLRCYSLVTKNCNLEINLKNCLTEE